jgi:hypothetical protein
MKLIYSLLIAFLVTGTISGQINTQLLADQLNFRDGIKTRAALAWDGTDVSLFNHTDSNSDLLLSAMNELIFQDNKENNHMRILSNGRITVGEDPLRPVDARLYIYNGDSGNPSNLGTTYGLHSRPAPSIWTRYGLYSYVSGAAEGVDISTQGQKIGLSVNARSSGASKIGVSAYAGVGTGSNYGVWSTVNGIGGAESYAIYGEAFGGNSTSTPAVWAGYFAGDVYSTGSYLPSDQKLKTNIRKAKSSLERLQQLPVKTYQYQEKYHRKMGLDTRPQTGFIAQEFASVFPELTRRVAQPLNHPEELPEGTKEEFLEFTGVNYVGLIPHLTQAIQEQQEQIKQLHAVNNELLERLERLEACLQNEEPNTANAAVIPLTSAWIAQNAPNPFSESTRITYFIPEQAQEAALEIVDAGGRMVKSIRIENRGKGEIRLQALNLRAGQYTYSLILDGRMVETQQMVLSK